MLTQNFLSKEKLSLLKPGTQPTNLVTCPPNQNKQTILSTLSISITPAMNDDVNEHQHYQVPSLDFQRLKVVSALGRGAKGVVFLVKDEESSEFLALKVIWRDLIENKNKDSNDNNNDEDDYKRVSFEQQVLQSFAHPLLPRLRGVLSTEKIIGYAIDYCPGRDMNFLRKKQTEKMFSDDTIRFYAAEMVLALEYLHNQGIVYRDLKPENIMVQENGHIMLVDFDLSTKLSPKTPQSSPEKTPTSVMKRPSDSVTKKRRSLFPSICNSGISPEDSVSSAQHSFKMVSKKEDSDHSTEKSNSFVGTEEYVAPEIISGDGHDFKADWWSLGIVLHEMLYGVTPFKGSNRKETFYRILCRPVELMGEPTALRNLIRKLLEKDPRKRIGVEEIKGHDFFRGMDWDLLLKVVRPPYIPCSEWENKSDGVIEGIDVESFVQGIFSSSGEGGKNKVDGVIVNNAAWSNGLNHQLPETDHFSVF